MAYFIGTIFGGFLIILLMSALTERFAFKAYEPTGRALRTVGSPTAFAAVLAGFGFADGGSYAFYIWPSYLIPAALVFFMFQRRYQKAWLADDDLDDVFN